MDFSVLERGSEISREECIQIVGVDPDAAKTLKDYRAALKNYAFKRLALAKGIERYFLAERGEKVVAKCVGQDGGLRVLSAQEQHEVAPKKWAKGVHYMQESIACDVGNDISQLTDDQQAERLKRIAARTWQLQQATKRKPPKLTGKE